MEDLFNFSNTDNILGTPKNINTPQATLGGAAKSQSSLSGDDVANDLNKKKAADHKKNKFRVVIVGDPQVGKTSFLSRHLNDTFDQTYRATIGASTFHLQFNTNLDVHKFEVLDVAGQNLFAGSRDKYYEDIQGAIIMYDVMNWGSYDNVTDIWLRELRQKAPSGIPIVVVGNKMENRDTRAVSVEVVAEAIKDSFEPKGIGYCEISVKTNQNLAEPFLFLTKRILNITDSKALYFVSKISELNLIESMLQHQNAKNIKQQTPNMTNMSSSASSQSQNLDNLFLNDTPMTMDTLSNDNNNGNAQKGGDYLDDIIFKIGDDNTSKNKKNSEKESESKTQSITTDDNFLANMMANNNNNITNKNININNTSKVSPKLKPKMATSSPKIKAKSKSISPKMQSANSQPLRNRANSAQTATNDKATAMVSKPRQSARTKSKSHAQQQHKARSAPQANDNGNADVMVDILLGIQESINALRSEVRRVQNDVNSIKHELGMRKNKI